MISKSSLGVLLAFAVLGLVVSALLGAVFPQHVVRSAGSPWGTIASISAPAGDHAATPPAAIAQVVPLLRLAPQPSASDAGSAPEGSGPAAATTAVASIAVLPSVPAPTPLTMSTPPTMSKQPRAEFVSVPAAEAVRTRATVAAVTPARHSDESSPLVEQNAARGRTDTAIDINRAPVDVLNRLPGVGRVGRTIVRHRPYRSIQDLVDRRVLRFSAFQKVKSMIKAD